MSERDQSGKPRPTPPHATPRPTHWRRMPAADRRYIVDLRLEEADTLVLQLGARATLPRDMVGHIVGSPSRYRTPAAETIEQLYREESGANLLFHVNGPEIEVWWDVGCDRYLLTPVLEEDR